MEGRKRQGQGINHISMAGDKTNNCKNCNTQRKIHILQTRETKKNRHRVDKEKDTAGGMRCVDIARRKTNYCT